MSFDEDVTIPAGITLLGANAETKATAEPRYNETVINGVVTVSEGSVIQGVTLTQKPVILCKETTFKNVRFVDIKIDYTTAEKNDHLKRSIIGSQGWDEPWLLTVEGCYFGISDGVYNTMEINRPLADGTSISNNYFAADKNVNNFINIYKIDDGATVTVKGNFFEYSGNAIRVAGYGDSQDAVVNILENEYDETYPTENYSGLLLVQPYGKATQSMAGITINMTNNINNSDFEQLWYYYAGGNDAQLNSANKPTIVINGVTQYILGYNLDADDTIDDGEVIIENLDPQVDDDI